MTQGFRFPMRRLSAKIRGQLALLRADPEKFARNLMQVTHKSLFNERLIDVLDAVPMHVRVDQALAQPATLNVLSSALTTNGMTGGPNTLLNLAVRIRMAKPGPRSTPSPIRTPTPISA